MTVENLRSSRAHLGTAVKAGWLTSPLVLLAAVILFCAAMLARPITVPFGAMYWDLVLYVDAANRIASGQIPAVDFFAPVGPLGYWLYFAIDRLFANGHPLLIAQWLTLPLTAPVMALVVAEVDRRSRPQALALLIPWALFQLAPVNVEQYSIFPGLDGFGIYNRHVCILLYALVAALVMLRDRRRLALCVAWLLLSLFLIKVTGFLAGVLLVGYAVLAGRIGFRQLGLAALAALLVCAVLQATTGLVSAYLASILELVRINSGSLVSRFAQAASLHLESFLSGLALVAALVILGRHEIAAALHGLLRARFALPSWPRLFDHEAGWVAAALAAGLFFETQNTGGQAFIFVIPTLVPIVARWVGRPLPGSLVVLGIVAFLAVPPIGHTTQRLGRSLLAQTGYVSLPQQHLGKLGRITQHRDVMERSLRTMRIYAAHASAFRGFADERILPAHTLYSELDFQAVWLMAADAGASAILAHEAQTGRRFETIMSLNFGNPFPALLGRTGVEHIPIGMDPYRAVPKPDPAELAAVAAADLVLKPRCPITVANDDIGAFFAPALVGRREIELGPCWTGYVLDTAPGLKR